MHRGHRSQCCTAAAVVVVMAAAFHSYGYPSHLDDVSEGHEGCMQDLLVHLLLQPPHVHISLWLRLFWHPTCSRPHSLLPTGPTSKQQWQIGRFDLTCTAFVGYHKVEDTKAAPQLPSGNLFFTRTRYDVCNESLRTCLFGPPALSLPVECDGLRCCGCGCASLLSLYPALQ